MTRTLLQITRKLANKLQVIGVIPLYMYINQSEAWKKVTDRHTFQNTGVDTHFSHSF